MQSKGLPPALVFCLYSEDRSDANQGFPTIEAVLRCMLTLVNPDTKSNHLRFEPTQKESGEDFKKTSKRRVCGSDWKVQPRARAGDQNRRRQLIQDVTTALARDRVVFFHVDGDEIWSAQDTAEVWTHLDRFRRDLAGAAGQMKKGTPVDPARIAEAFITAIPFYSIESWLYANIEHLRTLTTDPAELARIADWAADLAQLDEVAQIKNELPAIRDRHNAKLGRTSFPSRLLYDARTSYASTVDRLRGSSLVTTALTETAQRPY